MAITGQDLDVYRGAAAGFVVELEDHDGEPLDPATPLVYAIAMKAGAPRLLTMEVTAETNAGATIAEVVITREMSLTLPLGPRDRPAQLYHEVYTVEDGEDDFVLMTGTLTVHAAQIAEHSAESE